MTTTNPQPKRTPRRRFQFTLGWLLGLVAVANLYFAYFLYEPAKWDHARVHVAADAIFVGRDKVSWKKLPNRLEQLGRRSRSPDIPLSNIRVVLTVDDEATYGDFKRVAEQCWDSSVRFLELKISDRVGSFNVRGRSLVAPTSIEPEIPPYYVELKADSRGELVQIHMPVGPNRTLDQFRAGASEFVGSGRGPGSIHDIAEFEIHCDDHLKFKHVRAILDAMTEQPRPGGPRSGDSDDSTGAITGRDRDHPQRSSCRLLARRAAVDVAAWAYYAARHRQLGEDRPGGQTGAAEEANR